MTYKHHIPILVHEILEFIQPTYASIMDGTLGHAGHTIAMIRAMQTQGKQNIILDGYDLDPRVFVHAQEYIHEAFGDKGPANTTINIYNRGYQTATGLYDFILLDLGINREHVTDTSRGFSIHGDAALDMRFDCSGLTAYEMIKRSSLIQMEQWFLEYADCTPKRANTIAMILSNNKNNPTLATTKGLRDILAQVRVSSHELPVIFQAIRIATNDEFGRLRAFLDQIDTLLRPGGRCAIMSFHSVEDRIIKNAYKTLVDTGRYTLVNKKVIAPSWQEVKANKASRSAKLRVIEKNL